MYSSSFDKFSYVIITCCEDNLTIWKSNNDTFHPAIIICNYSP